MIYLHAIAPSQYGLFSLLIITPIYLYYCENEKEMSIATNFSSRYFKRDGNQDAYIVRPTIRLFINYAISKPHMRSGGKFAKSTKT